MIIYANRQAAVIVLAKKLATMKLPADTMVFALPRGGVPVAYEIAKKLNLPLDLMVVRKIGAPQHSEFAIGAIAANAVLLCDPLVRSQSEVQTIIAIENQERERREQIYRGGRPYPNLRGRTVIVVDDGVATGYTMQAAIMALKVLHPKKLILAIPVAAADALKRLAVEVDVVICPLIPAEFAAVAAWYKDFSQVSDQDVLHLLSELNIY